MNLKIYLIMLLSGIIMIYAAPVGRNTAETVAKNWLSTKSLSSEYQTVAEYLDIENVIHVFNFKNGGFALVAGDDASKPVLGYSLTGKFENSDDKTNINFWIGLYKKAINEIRTEKLGNEQTFVEWQNILKNEIPKNDTKEVLPLLASTWDQSPIYNMYCPLDGGSLSVVGCVATAMAQIMNYHEYPKTGKGSSSYSVLDQTLAVDYYLSRYNWDLMPNALSSGSSDQAKHETAQISYHAGVSVEMDYGAYGSGAYSEDVPNALKSYFKYNSAIYSTRSGYSATAWRDLLQAQLDISLPVYYSGSGPDGGHAFVCDGYQDADYYHFNWGWDGYADGYFSIDNLNPGGITFNDYQAVVRDIIPKTVDLVLEKPIEDIQTSESTYQIVLSEYFTSLSDDTITYSVDPSSNINGLQYNLLNGVLTLNRLEDGISKIVLIASTRNDNNFDEFYIQFGSNTLLAGFGKSYDFNSSAYLDAGNSSVLNSMEKIAFSSWIKFNAVGKDQGIASKTLSSNSGWYLMIQSNNLLKFSVKTQDGITRKIYSLQSLEANKWYHVDVMYDGKDLLIYINGELDNIKTTYVAVSNILHDSDQNLTLGYAYGLYLDGQIDEAILWDSPFSVTQVRQIMGQKPVVTLPDLISYWPLNEGFFASALDMAELHDGTFINNDPSNWQESDAPVYFFMGTNAVLNGILLGSYDETAVYNITQNPAMGNFEFTDQATGEFSYTPDTDISGLEEIKYTITYNKSVTPEKTVLISVKDSNGIESDSNKPASFELFQNYPNPFNPETSISFTLDNDMKANLTVYDMNGRTVRTLIDGFNKAGKYDIVWDGKDDMGKALASGIYYYRLSSEKFSTVKKAVMIK
ncbi:MAG: C10 family peptidase [Candidatus Delongbacteria bacterium]|nr:C10 family peptidase [Candidatus Delongbacteria bacterium]